MTYPFSYDRVAHVAISVVDDTGMHLDRSEHDYALLLCLHYFAWLRR